MGTTNNRKEISHSVPTFLKWLLSLLALGIVVFLWLLWFRLDDNINEIKELNKTNYEKIESLEKVSSIEIELTPYNKKHVLIEPKEIGKINNHIKSLIDEVQKEKNRTETLIDKDLSRLGSYMAIGIGFMTLLGVFVPILVNVLSVQDLRDKQNHISQTLNELTGENSSLDQALNKINTIESKTLNVSLDLCNLNLQNSIARFFNVGPLVLSRAISRNNFDKFVALLEDIKIAFENCKNNESHTITENNLFSKTVDDFIDFIDSEKFRFQSIFLKAEVEEFDNLIKHLGTLKDSNNDSESENYKALDGQINVIINIFNSKNAKNQPATQTS
ncbi:hypothetical protein [Flavobacterium lindanitolerans]|uniref:hypothetical protein n=1 Tax=Flavobacterium lindanitolerans TaxID=428988 RepID=UPI0027B9FD50|nr:hypothetical protein [Flavobacterium lindanitolerans]